MILPPVGRFDADAWERRGRRDAAMRLALRCKFEDAGLRALLLATGRQRLASIKASAVGGHVIFTPPCLFRMENMDNH